MRGTREVFDDHLRLALRGDVETDLERNYAGDVKVLTAWGVFEGHEGVRRLADRLMRMLGEPRFEYTTRLVAHEVAYLEWRSRAAQARVEDGADTFLIRDGKVQVQTIHYTAQKETG